MHLKLYKLMFVVFIFSSSIAFASGDYIALEGYPVGRCRLASNKAGKALAPLSRVENCSINVNFYYSGFDTGQELTPPQLYWYSFKGVTYWIEQFSKSQKKWIKISPSRQLERNNISKQINFKPKSSGDFRVAFDWYDMSFADDHSEKFSLTLK